MGDVSPVRQTADEGREKRLHSGSNGGRGGGERKVPRTGYFDRSDPPRIPGVCKEGGRAPR